MIPADQVTPRFSVGNCKVSTSWYPPPSAGKWIISGDFQIHVAKRPRWLTRKLMWWLVEWKWEGK